MNKIYNRTYWENEPSIETALNENNLNNIESGVDELDNRIISIDTTKASKTEMQTVISDVSFDESTGIFTFTRKNGATVTFDTKLEKLIVNFSFNYSTQKLVITLDDGTIQEIDLSALITQYEFLESETIAFALSQEGEISASIKEGSIGDKHLRSDYLASITVESAKATQAAKNALASENNAKTYSENAQAFFENMEEYFSFAINENGDLILTKTIND